jgi:hypothetical protein
MKKRGSPKKCARLAATFPSGRADRTRGRGTD